MPESEKKEEKIECFAYRGFKCEALYAHVPRECEKCRFRKPRRDVTDGKVYPFMNYGSK